MINCSSIPPSCRSHQRFDWLSHPNSPSLSVAQRGIHDIKNQLIFKSNPQFIFHDSHGFESGSLDEIKTVKSFIAKRARTRELPEQLHAIWCSGYDSTHEEKLMGSMTGTVSLQIPTGRYWRLTGIFLTNTGTEKVSDYLLSLRHDHPKACNIVLKYRLLRSSRNSTVLSPRHSTNFGKWKGLVLKKRRIRSLKEHKKC